MKQIDVLTTVTLKHTSYIFTLFNVLLHSGIHFFSPLLLPFICIYPETDMGMTLTHSLGCDVFFLYFFSFFVVAVVVIVTETTKEPFKTQNYN